jgi:hypothetical protein
MSARAWIVGAALVLVLVLAVRAVVVSSDRMREFLREAFEARGLPPEWGEALAATETGGGDPDAIRSDAVNDSGPDAARGGAYGATQITIQTARDAGFNVSAAELAASPVLQARITATLVAEGFGYKDGQPFRYGPPAPDDFERVAALWNAGKPPELLSSTSSARGYIAAATRALGRVTA